MDIICEYCDDSFGSLVEFFQHIRSHYEYLENGKTHRLEESLYTCPLCSDNFKDPYVKDLNVLCGAEFKGFWTADVLSSVQQKRNNGGVYICPCCEKNFTRHGDLKGHMKRIHGKFDEHLFCDKCFKTFTNPISLKLHKRIHTDDECFVCSYCQKKFARRTHLNRHVDRVHLKVDKEYRCDYCGKLFVDAQNLKFHIKMHTNDCLRCPQCPKTFCREDGLKKHLRKMHTYNPARYPCDLCTKIFVNEDDLKYHKRIHSETECFKCPLCQKKFGRSRHFEKHMERMHSTKKPFRCEGCAREFVDLYFFRQHKVETDNKCFKCSFCDRKFGRSGQLNHHIQRVHSQSNETFSCDMCDKVFSNNYHLKLHKRFHTDTECFPCPQCKRSFCRKGDLFRHINKVHEKITTPFLCDICPRVHFSEEEFKCHRRTHTGEVFSVYSHREAPIEQVFQTPCAGVSSVENGSTDQIKMKMDKFLACPHCQEKFSLRRALREHIVKEHIKTNNVYPCEVCAKVFTCKEYMVQHTKVHEDRCFICPHCARRYLKESTLNKHVEKVHNKIESCMEQKGKQFVISVVKDDTQ